MPVVNEPTMHELLWEWLSDRGYVVNGEVNLRTGRIDLVAHDRTTDEYLGIEVKDQAQEAETSAIPAAIEGVGEEALQRREDFDWDHYWEQLHQYQTSGCLDRLYFASQSPESIFQVIDESRVSRKGNKRVAALKDIYQDATSDRRDIGAIRMPGPVGDGSFEIVREAASLDRETAPSMSRKNERWVQHHIWEKFDGIREGVLPNRTTSTVRRIDVAAFSGPKDPTTVYERQPDYDIIGIEAKGQGLVHKQTAAITEQLTDYLMSGALTRLYLAVPAEDGAAALSMLQDAASDEQPELDDVGLYTVDKSGNVEQIRDGTQVTLRYDGIRTKEGYVADIIWGYSGDWDQDKQYYSVFEMES